MPPPDEQPERYSSPAIDLRAIKRMTDDTGIFQHAFYGVPDPNHGYCIDDNARALIAAVHHAQRFGYDETVLPLSRYLAFVAYAYNRDLGVFRNFMSYDRRWLEDRGSEDSQGRAIWALGIALRDGPTRDVRDLAGDLLRQALPGIRPIASLRAWAFALLGLNAYLDIEPGYAPVRNLRDHFADRLYTFYRGYATPDWPWWERQVSYDNAKLCQALYQSGRAMGHAQMQADAATSLRWLIDQQTETNNEGRTHLSLIGNDGWLEPDRPRARFDQQPLEAHALVEACLALAALEQGQAAQDWHDRARWCFEWFTGRNDLGQSLIDPDAGGCRDGLNPGGLNRNQGAESIFAYSHACILLNPHRP